MKRCRVEGIADVGAVLFEIVAKYEKSGFAEARMIPKDLKTARHIVDGFLNYVRGRHKRSNVIIKRLSLVFEKGRSDQIGSFILGMGTRTATNIPRTVRLSVSPTPKGWAGRRIDRSEMRQVKIKNR